MLERTAMLIDGAKFRENDFPYRGEKNVAGLISVTNQVSPSAKS